LCIKIEKTAAPRTEPTIASTAGVDDDDGSPWIADEDMMEDEGDEWNGESVVGVVMSEIVRIEDGDDGDVEGSADAEVAVAIIGNV
jgi:hypothetical protein